MNTLVFESFFNKDAGLKACNFIKEETTTQAFSCEYYNIFENNFFYRTLPVAASNNNLLQHRKTWKSLHVLYCIFLIIIASSFSFTAKQTRHPLIIFKSQPPAGENSYSAVIGN